MASSVWGIARSLRESKEPGEPQESGFSPKKSESSARNVVFHHVPYNENPMRALNTTSLKCCLPSTDAIDRWEKKFTHAYEGSRSPHARASLKSTRFLQKRK